MDSTVYNSLKRLRIDDTDEDRQTKRPSMQSWSQRPGSFMNTIPTNNDAASYSHDVINNVSSADRTVHHHQQIFKSFMVSTKTNTEYNHVNRVLNKIHVHRYGDPEEQEGWWEAEENTNMKEVMVLDEEGGESNEKDTDDIQPMEDVSFYMAANTILREAFLQRHQADHQP
ncbi:hypothetical protein K492DRAFT_208714 [Lichtheimia hyalospora FSU 10163]|nr:hypothetical protein K492DRAFT_208714 [Lichtheimia hyalospora FSU 10163]